MSLKSVWKRKHAPAVTVTMREVDYVAYTMDQVVSVIEGVSSQPGAVVGKAWVEDPFKKMDEMGRDSANEWNRVAREAYEKKIGDK